MQSLATLSEVGRVHARKMPMSSDEAVIANRPSGVQRVEFLIRRTALTKDIATNWRLVECNATDAAIDLVETSPGARPVWRILGIEDREERGRNFHLIAESVRNGR
ncbi:MAG: head-tail adaptor protein [Henriciella sp.]|nr:head-tail adaptor protein [Henriciella sp.]